MAGNCQRLLRFRPTGCACSTGSAELSNIVVLWQNARPGAPLSVESLAIRDRPVYRRDCMPQAASEPYGDAEMPSVMDLPSFAAIVLFAGLTGIAMALRAGADGSDRTAWAGANVLASLSGMLLALNASWDVAALAVAGHMVGIVGQLGLLQSLRRPQPPDGARAHWSQNVPAGAMVVIGLAAMLAAHLDPALIALLGHGATVAVVCVTTDTLLRDRRRATGMGRPLALVACLVQLTAQGGFLVMLGWHWEDGPLLLSMMPAAIQWLGCMPVLLLLMATFASIAAFALMAIEDRAALDMARARLDPLTGVLHRGALDKHALRMAAAHARHGKPLACLVIDIDYFKRVNDNAGHRAGDMVLQAVARVLRDTVRTIDVVGRYGGEEFCVLCPRTTVEEAAAIAKRVRERVCTLPLPAPLPGHVSVSIGVAAVEVAGDARRAWDTLFEAADRALYVSKRAGRNGVVCADASLLQPYTTLACATGER